MAVTRKIKVNSVQVGDPSFTVQFQVEDTGTFPTFVQMIAQVTIPGAASPTWFSGIGQTNVAPNSSTVVTIICQFPDSTFAPGQNFDYVINSVQFSDSRQGPWALYTGPQDGLPWSSSVQSNELLAAAAKKSAASPAPASFVGSILAFFRRLFG